MVHRANPRRMAESMIRIQPSRREAGLLKAEIRMWVDAAPLHGLQVVGYETESMGVYALEGSEPQPSGRQSRR